jgi:hypothetical protein
MSFELNMTHLKKKLPEGTGDIAQQAECLCGKHEALCSNSSTTTKTNKKLPTRQELMVSKTYPLYQQQHNYSLGKTIPSRPKRLLSFCFFGSTGVWTYCFALARQILFCLSHNSSLSFCFWGTRYIYMSIFFFFFSFYFIIFCIYLHVYVLFVSHEHF